MDAQKKAERGRDLAAPVKFVSYRGEKLPLKFCNRAYLVAEDVYEDVYHRNAGIYQIMQEAAVPKQRALMAVFYGAMIAGGAKIEWADFENDFAITDIDGIADAIQRGMLESLPEPDPKNAAATTGATETSAIPGRG